MEQSQRTHIQAKLFEYALFEMVRRHRDTFQPLWTVDSWAKFLIWMALNCGLSGDQESLQLFADAMGEPLTCRMRRLFFERTLEELGVKVMADPSEKQVLVMPLAGGASINSEVLMTALAEVGLTTRIVAESTQWHTLDSLVAIPWQDSESVC